MEDSKALDKKIRLKEYRIKHREAYRKSFDKWRRLHPEEYRQMSLRGARRYYFKSKDSLYEILGRRCVRCGFSDIRALQLDHINGGGIMDTKVLGGACNSLKYYTLRPDLAKERLQILCANCNWIKRDEQKEHFRNQPRAWRIRKRNNSRFVRARPITIDDFLI